MNLKGKKVRYAKEKKKKKRLKATEGVPDTTLKGFLNYCQERISWLFNRKYEQVVDEKGKTAKVNFFST